MPFLRPSRRRFLQQLAAVGIAAPAFIRNLRAAPPSETVRHASFGASGMAGADLRAIASHKSAKLMCVADVDTSRGEALKKDFPEIRVYQDWRQLLDKEQKNLDSVNVSTPDHMHAPIGMSAMQLGLAVYGQKPLTHDVYETRKLTEYARDKKLVTQMGIQVHSAAEYRNAVHLVQAGAIGKIKEVHTWSSKKWGDPAPLPERTDAPPATLDWDLWLGVAAERPFIGDGYYHPGNWRKRIDFGTGTFGDMGCHIYDPVFGALALTAPISVRSEGPRPSPHNWANDAVVHYLFPGTKFTAGKTVSVTWYDGDQRPPLEIQGLLGKQGMPDQGSIFIGEGGIMLDRKDIDAVVVCTPDHWHALATIHACQAGKDVYCEKPLSLTIAEGRKMVEAARANKRVVQTGSQQRSDAKFRQACEYVQSGRLGTIKEVLVGIPGPNHPKMAVPDSDPPSELDYEMWLGPAPQRPYNVNRVHYNFRFFWDYSGGQMTNFGAHNIDIAQWGLGMDGSGPVSSEGTATYVPDRSICEVTLACRVTHTYANGVKMIVGQGQKDIHEGITFVGEKGRISVSRGKIASDPADLLNEPLTGSDTRLYASENHHTDFLACIKSRKNPVADVEIGHRTATVCHLGNIALRLGRKVTWDPATEQITGDDAAAKWLSRPYRAPWKLG